MEEDERKGGDGKYEGEKGSNLEISCCARLKKGNMRGERRVSIVRASDAAITRY